MSNLKSVENGAALLDERLPGWRAHVDPDTLDLSHSCNCVLGELFGDYGKGVEILKVNPVRFGFMSTARISFARLTEEWRKVLGA